MIGSRYCYIPFLVLLCISLLVQARPSEADDDWDLIDSYRMARKNDCKFGCEHLDSLRLEQEVLPSLFSERNTRDLVMAKRAMMRLGKRAMMRLGKRAMMRLGK